MADIKFRKVSDDLVEVLCDGIINIVSKEEAIQLGYTEFTYKGKPIAFATFCKLVGKNYNAANMLMHRYNYHTGEEIINHCNKNIRLTYQGKPITIIDFAKLIGKSFDAIKSIIKRYKYRTGEEVIDHYNNKKFTYQGKAICIVDFARLIGKSSRAVNIIIYKYRYHTGEEVIEHYTKFENNRVIKVTYRGNPITIAALAKLVGKSSEAVRSLAVRYNYSTGEEIINHYNNNETLTYQGKHITIIDFAKLIGKHRNTLYRIIRMYNYHTGEEIIEHYGMKGKL